MPGPPMEPYRRGEITRCAPGPPKVARKELGFAELLAIDDRRWSSTGICRGDRPIPLSGALEKKFCRAVFRASCESSVVCRSSLCRDTSRCIASAIREISRRSNPARPAPFGRSGRA